MQILRAEKGEFGVVLVGYDMSAGVMLVSLVGWYRGMQTEKVMYEVPSREGQDDEK